MQAAQDDSQKNLRSITEVAFTTMSSHGIKLTFDEFMRKPTHGLYYTLSHCTFPLLEEVLKVIVEVGTDPPDEAPRDLYKARAHDFKRLQRYLQMPTVFEPEAYQQFIAGVNRNMRASRPPGTSSRVYSVNGHCSLATQCSITSSRPPAKSGRNRSIWSMVRQCTYPWICSPRVRSHTMAAHRVSAV